MNEHKSQHGLPQPSVQPGRGCPHTSRGSSGERRTQQGDRSLFLYLNILTSTVEHPPTATSGRPCLNTKQRERAHINLHRSSSPQPLSAPILAYAAHLASPLSIVCLLCVCRVRLCVRVPHGPHSWAFGPLGGGVGPWALFGVSVCLFSCMIDVYGSISLLLSTERPMLVQFVHRGWTHACCWRTHAWLLGMTMNRHTHGLPQRAAGPRLPTYITRQFGGAPDPTGRPEFFLTS